MIELAEEIVEKTPHFLRVRLPEVGGGYELTCSPEMVQAVGTCDEVNFYFRAKYQEWVFETEDEHGHPFPVGDLRQFLRHGNYNESKPNALGLEWSTRILRRCLAQWWCAGTEPSVSADSEV